jgi:hypothetical protein
MRSLQLVYIFMFLALGGVLGEYLLQRRVWRWLALFVPVGAGMFLVGGSLYPRSRRIEWPVAQAAGDPWLEAFYWIRGNTPKDAVFALDPEYMRRDDEHGFRAVAERSSLADAVKDSGAAAMFPAMAEDWKQQQEAQAGWARFGPADYARLRREYGVDWVVVEGAGAGLVCPYRNARLSVCQD